MEGFRQALRDLGYVEGQNIALEIRWAEGRFDQFPALAAELVGLKVDVIVATGAAARAASQATTTIPIVMAPVADPVGIGLVASLPRPGGNVTGLSFMVPALSAKRLELLREVVRRTPRIAVLFEGDDRVNQLEFEQTNAAAAALGVTLQPLGVKSPDEFAAAFSAARKERAAALIVLSHPFTVVHRKEIVDLGAKSRLPAIYGLREFVDIGWPISYGPNFDNTYRRAATYVDKILKGVKPVDLTVEQPTRFELVVNMKTARALGLTFPPSILIRADQMIQ